MRNGKREKALRRAGIAVCYLNCETCERKLCTGARALAGEQGEGRRRKEEGGRRDEGDGTATMQVIEKKVRVAVGLNEMARRLGCSRGHLSLVIHGRRKSGRLERRLKAMGFSVKEAV